MDIRRVGLISLSSLAVLLASCGGGGGSGNDTQPPPPQPTITFSATSLSFKAAAPYSAAPANQTITGTVTGPAAGTLYVTIVENTPEVVTVSTVTIVNNSGQATVIPASPAALLAGTHQGSFTVHACLNDPTCATGQLAGSPQTITVTYDIGSTVDADTVTPRVVTASIPGSVILRGHGFSGASTVAFGGTAASSMSVISDTEIHASYPSLPAGSYPISVDSGNVVYNATLKAIAPPAFGAVLLPYPVPTPFAIRAVTYDPERSALYVTIDQGGGNLLALRYAFDGSTWGSPTQLALNGLQQLSVSPDGTTLLAAIETANPMTLTMVELDPVTLAETGSTPFPDTLGQPAGTPGAQFAYSNDGNAIVYAAGMTTLWVYGAASHKFTALGDGTCGPVASGDGSMVMLCGDAEYVASTGTIRHPQGSVGGAQISADLTGSKFAATYGVWGADGQMLGLPLSTVGVVVNLAGTRLYGMQDYNLDPQPRLHTFDLTATPVGGYYPELGTAIMLAGDTGVGSSAYPALAITPDGGTVFVAGVNGVAVQPVPP